MIKFIKYIPDIILTFLFVFSFFPYFNIQDHSSTFYVFCGGFISFMSYMSFGVVKPKHPASIYYTILVFSILILFFVSLFFLHNIKNTDKCSEFEKQLFVLFGGFFGIVIAGFIDGKTTKN